MAIRIKKVSEDLYSAELTLPDIQAVQDEWSTPQPMSSDQLIEELLKRGAHQTDIGDAFYTADPSWLSK
jgi:hypothetical protein